MATMYVDVEALNFRTTPAVQPDNRNPRVPVLHLCQKVDTLGSVDANGWAKIRVMSHAGLNEEGFVSGKFLRNPASEAREALVLQAITEWLRFEKGLGEETDDPFFKHIGEMWRAIGENHDGKDTDIFWSAAAISFMVRNAGGAFPMYGQFKFAGQHSKYVHDAIKRRFAEDTTAPFWGFRLFEAKPQIGDIVCNWRETPRTFSDATVRDDYKGHCDIIVRVGPDDLQAIGGNVGDSVGLTTYRKTPTGFVDGSGKAFALLVNRVS